MEKPTTTEHVAFSGITTATYAAFVQHNDKFYEGPAMTIAEFRQFDPRKMEVAHA